MLVAGVTLYTWLQLLFATHRVTETGLVPWCTPDGRPMLRQPNPAVEAFAALRAGFDDGYAARLARDKT